MFDLRKILILITYVHNHIHCLNSFTLQNDNFIATIFVSNKQSSCNAIVVSGTNVITTRSCLDQERHGTKELEVCYYPGQCLSKKSVNFCTQVTPVGRSFGSDLVVLDTNTELALFDESVAVNVNQWWNVTEIVGKIGYVTLCAGSV